MSRRRGLIHPITTNDTQRTMIQQPLRHLLFAPLLAMFLVMAAASTAGAGQRFTAGSDGTVIDHQQHLMWAAASSAATLRWSGALLYAEEYTAAGHDDWRLPNRLELASLYDPASDRADGLALPPFFTLASVLVWTGEQQACKAWCLDVTSGMLLKMKGSRTDLAVALPVRTLPASGEQ